MTNDDIGRDALRRISVASPMPSACTPIRLSSGSCARPDGRTTSARHIRENPSA